jgi:hypothetical protein
MNRLLLTAALFALAAPAHADNVKLPKEYLGTWCVDQITDTDTFHNRRGNCPTAGEGEHAVTIVRSDAITFYDGKTCKLVSSKLSPPYGSDRTYFVTYQCKGEKLTRELYRMKDGTFRLTVMGEIK